jgi:2-polyprenyl-3-methyl-5-hydroxy-6-metoxy-1,4-benzoquinol methylase
MSNTGKSRHNYEYDVLLESDTAPARVVRLVGSGKRVLEVGAGPGSITRHLVDRNEVVAVEIDSSAIEKLKNYCRSIYQLNLNDAEWPDQLAGEGKFDVVIAADVLEHVLNPLQTLRGMKSLLRPGGEIILSLPHVAHAVVVGCLLDEDFDYRDWGLLDRTHLRFFGLKNINRLYADAGLAIEEAQFVVRTPEMTEFWPRWQTLPKDAQQVILRNPRSLVYQVVSRAREAELVPTPVDLMSVDVQLPPGVQLSAGSVIVAGGSLVDRLKVHARRNLSERTRARVKRVLNAVNIRL